MKVGIPREVKNHEYRVAITPAGVRELAGHGHEVYVEKGAGDGSSFEDDAYVAAGATIIPDPDEVWRVADLVLKVKEPVSEEYHRMREGQVLFTYLHLAADKACTDALLRNGITAIAYETVQLADGSLPLLAPMSEVAGRDVGVVLERGAVARALLHVDPVAAAGQLAHAGRRDRDAVFVVLDLAGNADLHEGLPFADVLRPSWLQ